MSSRVRPSRDCSPNSRTVSSNRRRLTRRRTAAGTWPAFARSPELRELVAVGEVGRQDPVAAVRVVAGLLEDAVDEQVEADGLVADRAAQHGTQREAVRAALHEAGPVRGVLDAVGEDQGLLLGLVELVAPEDRRERHRQQGGDRGPEEPDAVLLHAGRAGVVNGERPRVRPAVGQHRQHTALRDIGVVVWLIEEDAPLGGVEPHETWLVGVAEDGASAPPSAASAGA